MQDGFPRLRFLQLSEPPGLSRMFHRIQKDGDRSISTSPVPLSFSGWRTSERLI